MTAPVTARDGSRRALRFGSHADSLLGDRGMRWWRIVTAWAFAGAFSATHWPKLVFGPEAPSDKVLHALTFGILTFMLSRARLINNQKLLLLAMIVFATFDEVTQSLPFIQRHTSIADWIADCVGISVPAAVMAMQTRVTAPIEKMRGALACAARRAVIDQPFNWMALATSAALGALVGFPLAIAFEHTFFRDSHPWQSGLLGGVFFAIVAGEIAHRSASRVATQRITARTLCFRCGACATTSADSTVESGTCQACAAPWQRAQWVMPCALFGRAPDHYVRMALQSGVRGAIYVTGALLALGTVIALAAQYIVPRGISLIALAEVREMRDVIVYALAILATALIMSVMNAAYGRVREREGDLCLSCNFDLRATPARAGVGGCPECATEFARVAPSNPMVCTASNHSDGGANPSGPMEGCVPPPG